MKKTLLILSSFFTLVYSVNAAAPTLTQSNSAPAVGDVWKMYGCDTLAVQGAAGASQTWTITVAVNTSAFSTGNIVATSSTPYAANFPNSNVAVYYAAQSYYQFFSSSSTAVKQWGTYTTQGLQIFDAPGISFFTYPFTYNTVASTPTITGTSPPGPLTGNSTCTGDAWGNLILNGKTWSNVLRHKQDQTIDYDYGGGYHYIVKTLSYSWYDGIHKTPILQITYQDASGIATNHSKGVSVSDFVVTGIEVLSAKLNFDVYPNPSYGQVNVSLAAGQHGDVSFHVYNSEGVLVKEINREPFAPVIKTLDLSALAKGIYMIEVSVGEAKATRRIIVE